MVATYGAAGREVLELADGTCQPYTRSAADKPDDTLRMRWTIVLHF